MTAKHVIEEFLDIFGASPKTGSVKGNFSVMLHQQAGDEEFLWQPERIWPCPLTDVAILRVTPFPAEDPRPRNPWGMFKMGLLPPAPGTPVTAFGYHSTSAKLTAEESIEWRVDAATVEGEVIEVHRLARDASRLRFPTFRVDARFDGSMSGGPVVNNETGELCGIICSNLPPTPGTDEAHISYACSLWPALGTVLDSFHESQATTLLDLARQEIIYAPEWRRFRITDIEDDGRTVKMEAEFPKIEGRFEALHLLDNMKVEIHFGFTVDDGPPQHHSVVLDHPAPDDGATLPLTPPYTGPWDEAEFSKVVRQYVEIATAPNAPAIINFRMAAQHLGRRKRGEKRA
jgi:hypothetical protein